MPEQNQNKMEIELVKKDVMLITRLLERYDATLQKLQDVAIDLSKVVSIQEQKLQMEEKAQLRDSQILQKLKQDTTDDIRELHDKVNAVKSDLTEKIDNTEANILNEIHKLRKDTDDKNIGMNNKITAIEIWRYGIMGAIALGVFLLSKAVDVAKLFH